MDGARVQGAGKSSKCLKSHALSERVEIFCLCRVRTFSLIIMGLSTSQCTGNKYILKCIQHCSRLSHDGLFIKIGRKQKRHYY